MKRNIFLFIFLCILCVTYGQNSKLSKEKKWFIELDMGIQMSGIKGVDFIKSNYSPMYRISGGKWLNNSIALKIGYQGRYFNTIDHTRKRFYDFYFGEVLFDLKQIVLNQSTQKRRFHEVLLHIGSGYFYNHDYKRPNITAIGGISNNFYFWNSFAIKVDVSAIAGWDIYQGDDDILPNTSIGLVYLF